MNIYTLIYYFRHLQHWWFRYNLKILTISASLQPANEVVEGNVFSCVWLFISHDAIGQSQVTWDLSTHSHSPGPVAHMGLPQPQLPTDMIKLVPFGSTPWTSWKVAFDWKVFMFEWVNKTEKTFIIGKIYICDCQKEFWSGAKNSMLLTLHIIQGDVVSSLFSKMGHSFSYHKAQFHVISWNNSSRIWRQNMGCGLIVYFAKIKSSFSVYSTNTSLLSFMM